MKTGLAVAVVLSCALAGVSESPGPRPQPAKIGGELDAEQVRSAIEHGVKFLKLKQLPAEGDWEAGDLKLSSRGGQTALALLALLNAGVPVDDAVVKRGLASLRALEKPSTYVRSLQTMVFVEAGRPEDTERIRENVKHLLKIAVFDGENLVGWRYDQGQSGMPQRTDLSNTQYALLALWTARQAKVEVDGLWEGKVKSGKKFWEEVRDLFTRADEARRVALCSL